MGSAWMRAVALMELKKRNRAGCLCDFVQRLRRWKTLAISGSKVSRRWLKLTVQAQ